VFLLVQFEEMVKIEPREFDKPVEQTALSILKTKYERQVVRGLGEILAILDVRVNPYGRVLPGEGCTVHTATVTALVFSPEPGEVMEGQVSDIADFGAFVRVLPHREVFLHISQVTDDAVRYDKASNTLVGRTTHRVLRIGDYIRFRISSVSEYRPGRAWKIGVTCRQPGLGKFEWIRAELQPEEEKKKKKAKKAGK